MKLGLIADVHGNLEGLRLALDRLGPVDELLCAGDAVYQFRFSNEVVALLRERGARYVLGNHERVLLGPWGEAARSRPTVRGDLLAYMAGQPYRADTWVNGRKLVLVHGSPFEPHDEYLYPNSPGLQKLAQIEADFIVLGHTHYHMALPIGRGAPGPSRGTAPSQSRGALAINPGSCGEPRDHRNGFRLSCAVLDTQSGEVTFHHFDDPTRPQVDPATVPQPTAGGQQKFRPPENVAWWAP